MPGGVKYPSLIFFANVQDFSDASGRADPTTLQGFYLDPLRVGAKTEKIEVHVNPREGVNALGGAKAASFLNDFYDRVHFRPVPFQFGAISQPKTLTMEIWNAHFVTNGLTSISIPEIQVSYDGTEPPYDYGPLEQQTHEWTAQAEGVISFADRVEFEFELKAPYYVLFTGDRAVLVDKGPNWGQGLTETLEFQTEVFRSRDGTEQRRSLRQEARRTISYTLDVQQDRRRRVESFLTRWRRRVLVTPFWPWRTHTTAAASTGSADLSVAHVPNWAQAGVNVLIRHGQMKDVTAVIGSVSEGTITLNSALAQDIPAGAFVIQTMATRIRDGQQVQRITADVATVPYAFDVRPGVDPAYVPPAASEFHDGFEVFVDHPNWGQGIEEQWNFVTDEVDTGYSATVFYEPQDFAQYTMRVQYLGLRDTKVQSLMDLFLRQRGQRGEFWLPTFGRDIIVGQPLEESATIIRVPSEDFQLDWADQPTNQALIIWLTDGSYLIRNVVEISTATDLLSNASVITVDEPWGRDYALSEIKKVSWLMRVRFATDTLRIEWPHTEAANVQFSVQTQEVQE